MRKRRERKAFTLLELLIVIVIIGVLAVVAVPQYMGAVVQAKQNTGNANAAVLADVCGKIQSVGGTCSTVAVTGGIGINPQTVDSVTYGVTVTDNNFTFAVTPRVGTTQGSVVATANTTKCSGCTNKTVNW